MSSEPVRNGHPRFYEILEELADLHERKNSDYAGEQHPLANFLESQRFGVSPFLGVLVRLSDKWSRICSLTAKAHGEIGQINPSVADEGIIDTLRDMASYSVLAIILLEESKASTEDVATNEDKIRKALEEIKNQSSASRIGAFDGFYKLAGDRSRQ